MDKLWAPWRAKYIKQIGKTKACVFCRILNAHQNSRDFVFIRTPLSYAVLNIYPYNNGHALILPNRHVDDISKLSQAERGDMLDTLEATKSLLEKVLKPDGFNIGINLGRAAGAGFPGHLHIHIVPRWTGDANFMPAVAETRVVSQSLKVLYKKLAHAHTKRHRRT